MERLTTSQIADFNNPLAFARAREARVGQQAIEAPRGRPEIRTENAEESFRLVTGAEKRLETLQGNLTTMRQLAQEGEGARGNERKLREIYGKLRSLSAGFDQVVEAIRFKGRPVFTGEPVALDLGPGTRPLDLEVSRLLTYGDDSLGLSTSRPTAEATIRFRTEDRIVNSGYDIIGLDIREASYLASGNEALELEDGDYKVAISYEGANSSVELRSMEGALIERQENVDLSGTGSQWVDFDTGVRLTFEMENFFSSFDKFDFEERGPAELRATLSYRRLEAHELRTGDEPAPESASFLYDTPLTIQDTSLGVAEPVLSPVAPDRQPLESGTYSLNIEYRGENSVIRLNDALGRLKAFRFDVDLSGTGSRTIDLENGLSFTVDNNAFQTEGASLTVPLAYNREPPPLEEFDFSQYSGKIDEAIAVVEEQRALIGEARQRIEELSQQRASAQRRSAGNPQASVLSLNASGALSLLSGANGSSLFAAASAGSRTANVANQLFSTSGALATQANQTPQQLASLQNAAATNTWLGNG